MEFEQDFPDARTILLEQNYRSTQTILRVGQRGDRAQPGPPGQAAVVRSGRRGEGRRLRRRQRARRGRVRRAGDRPAGRHRRLPELRHRGVLPDQLAVPGLRGRVHAGRAAVQGGRRGALLRAPGGPRRAGLPAGAVQPGGHGQPAPDPQRAQARHRRPGRGAGGHLRRPGADLVRRGAADRRGAARSASPGWSPARSAASPRSCASSTTSPSWSSAATRRPSCWRRCTRAPATPRSWRPARTRRTAPGWRTWPSW